LKYVLDLENQEVIKSTFYSVDYY